MIEISDIVNDGNLFSYSGVKVNFINKEITLVPPKKTFKIDETHIERIFECIDTNLEKIYTELDYKSNRLKQTKEIIIPIENGYKIRKPLSATLREIYTKDVEILTKNKDFLENITEKDLL